METKLNNQMVHHLEYQGRAIILVGTAHVSRQSAELVETIIQETKPDTVCVELCESRFQSIRNRKTWQEMDIIKVIREKKAFVLLANLLLASFQKRLASRFDIKPGEEMIRAMDAAEAIGAQLHLADRDIRTTLSRVWRSMGLWKKIKLLMQLLLSVGEANEISEEQIEQLKQQDVLESLMAEIGEAMPEVRASLIEERDWYLCEKIRSAPGERIVAVVGAGHLAGILKSWTQPIDLAPLETLPPPRRTTKVLKWLIPSAILILLAYGFYRGGTQTGTDMVAWWVALNGILAGIGAVAAMGHPFTIASAVLAAPITSLNPMIAAGWVSGLVEAFSRRPKVADFEQLPEDISSVKGFWRNKVTRILLVVLFTNLGSSIGTFVALPLMIRLLNSS